MKQKLSSNPVHLWEGTALYNEFVSNVYFTFPQPNYLLYQIKKVSILNTHLDSLYNIGSMHNKVIFETQTKSW